MRRNEDALFNRDAAKCQEGAAEVDETALAEGGLLAIVDVGMFFLWVVRSFCITSGFQ